MLIRTPKVLVKKTKILIYPQIMFNIRNLIYIICGPIIVVHLNKMCVKKFTSNKWYTIDICDNYNISANIFVIYGWKRCRIIYARVGVWTTLVHLKRIFDHWTT
jgi:hypothetical protein